MSGAIIIICSSTFRPRGEQSAQGEIEKLDWKEPGAIPEMGHINCKLQIMYLSSITKQNSSGGIDFINVWQATRSLI